MATDGAIPPAANDATATDSGPRHREDRRHVQIGYSIQNLGGDETVTLLAYLRDVAWELMFAAAGRLWTVMC